jgi:tRNA-2-methylthio-N6-dimethylallyladenosine synthase
MTEQRIEMTDQATMQKIIIKRLNERFKGKDLKYHVATFGCQMNARDSEKIIGVLEEIGYTYAEKEEEADFIIYNTCCVRENAEKKVYGRLGYLKSLKKKNNNLLIALCGCMMQQDVVVNKLKESYRQVDIIFGTHNIYKLAELIEARLDSHEMIIDIWEGYKEIVEDLPSIRKNAFKASVNVVYGCNNFCSYCIVPYVRGRERSRLPKDILREVEALTQDGVVEITLLGQNVNSYGQTFDEPFSFAKLLQMLEKVEGLKRLRFMTPHPKDLSDELIEVMSKSTKICNHLHLPFQSGSTKVLEKMNRKYTKEAYLNLVKKIKAACPGIALTTDIIVGFPGETEEDFEETLDVVRQVRYNQAFTFIYSIRTGTKAATMPDQIPEEVIKDRFNRLLTLVNDIAEEKSKGHIGSIQEVLVEEVNKQDECLVTGRTSDNSIVHFNGCAELIGKLVMVEIVSARSFYLRGKLVKVL